MFRIPNIMYIMGLISVTAALNIFHPLPPIPPSPAPPVDYISSNPPTDPSFLSNLEASFLGKSLDKRQGNPTRDDLINGKCNDVIIIFARGTGAEGNIGFGLGPSFIAKVEAALPGRVIAQGVLPYAADLIGYLQGGSAEGGRSMKALTERAAKQCPDAQIVLSGYSQGAQVTHIAAGLLSPVLSRRIAAIVTFGDPKRDDAFPSTLQSKSFVICNPGDLICDGKPIVQQPHSPEAYEARMPEAVAWITARISPRVGSSTTATITDVDTTSAKYNYIATETITSIPNSTSSSTGGSATLESATTTVPPSTETSTSTAFRIKIPRAFFLISASAFITFWF